MTEQELLQTYPSIFKEGFPGIKCGKGWLRLIQLLCYHLTALTDHENHPSVEFFQVKEKFGRLIIHYNYNKVSKTQQELIEFTENLADITCEYCGKPGELRHGDWVKTLCDDCKE